MNVKLRVLTAGVLFFTGHAVFAQNKAANDSTKNTKQIDEVVVLGYNKTQTKPKDVTASTTVTAEKLENRPNVSFLNSLQGEAPGLTINSASGSPGSAKIDVIIRGVSSISASSDPLYVIDGMISNSTQFRNLNTNDIESISILKDAAATSIYGNRGGNGVIVIRTKQGKYGTNRFALTYTGTTGIGLLPKTHYNMANAKELLTIQNRLGQGLGSQMSLDQIAAYSGPDTNWSKELFRTGFTQTHDLGMSFGAQNVNNYTSIGYMEQTGTVPTTDFKRFTLRNNLNGKSSNGRFTYNSNIGIGYSKRHQLDEETNSGISSNVIQNPLLTGITALPTMQSNKYMTGQALYDAIGSATGGGNSVWVLQDILRGTLPNQLNETSIVANFAASYKLTDDLTVSNKSGVDYKYSERMFARAPYSYLGIVVAKGSATTANPNPFGGIERITKENDFTFNSVTSLAYHKTFNEKHTLDAAVYLDYMKSHYNASSQTQNGLYPLTWQFGAGTGYVPPAYFPNGTLPPIVYYVPTISASKIKAGTLAYFATVDYDYDSKYGVSGVVRRDGSYRFTGDNQWATFWSVAGRWNIDKESFMEGSTFDMLKLRGSYGTNGNQNIIAAAYGANPLLPASNIVRPFITQSAGYDIQQGALYPSGLQNPGIQWEVIGQLDLGLDFRLLNRKLEGSIDVYDKRTDKLFNSLPISNINGQSTINYNNGKLQNRGIEVLLRYNIINKQDVKLSIYANSAYNKSKFLSLAKDDSAGDLRNVTGGMLGEWYLISYAGVNKDNGNMLFYDKDGRVTENPNAVSDQLKTGKSYLPKWSGGFGLNAEYKGVFLDAHFSYQADVWKWDNQLTYVYDSSSAGNFNVSSDLLNAWTPTNMDTNIPSFNATNKSLADNSDRYLKDASFIRLKTITLGYNIPKNLLGNSVFIKSAKVFLSGENLFTFTKWKGYDPEPTFAYSTSVYPNLKTFSIGATLDF
ncbi:SusC/RagA family TonB-linked outer membrane protein [Chryseobacterium sp. Tr-659]|uniref:SusC/RagA family TonB-linked outer membrane protein n=1 Tax=Chryseobacterium sp. Tr-659 TaxID=2608340 RepID=UPI00141E1437|nr:SusC/RagA family TonB-linked outer membrane protein [Chryseobacterium sp. Tr-659]NIF05466.1 SusC/RagA family TonB-linked outer membrane protein [Chryseobacterium sp. Tr-659]